MSETNSPSRPNIHPSTGPRTAAGKNASSRNGLTHGLTARKHLILDEDLTEFNLLLDDLRARFRPLGAAEDRLVYRIAVCQWNIDRAPAMEAAIYRYALQEVHSRDQADQLAYEAALADALDHDEPAPPPPIPTDPDDLAGCAFAVDCEGSRALLLLARYTTSFERSIERCLRQLKLFQAARQEAAQAASPAVSPTPNEPELPAAQPPTPFHRPQNKRIAKRTPPPPPVYRFGPAADLISHPPGRLISAS